MQRTTIMRNLALAALGFGAGVGVLGWSSADSSSSRPGLEAYRSEAMKAAAPSDGLSNHSTSEITMVMEIRNVCLALDQYTRDKAASPDLLAKRLWAGAERARNAPDGKADGGTSIDEYVRVALAQVDAARTEGSMAPIQAFVKSECDPKQDLSQPILTSDGG